MLKAYTEFPLLTKRGSDFVWDPKNWYFQSFGVWRFEKKKLLQIWARLGETLLARSIFKNLASTLQAEILVLLSVLDSY